MEFNLLTIELDGFKGIGGAWIWFKFFVNKLFLGGSCGTSLDELRLLNLKIIDKFY